MKVVVLAGDEGTRLRPLTLTRPKPMIPIGPRPALYYTLSSLAAQGFKDILVIVGYKKEQIMGYFGDGRELGLQTDYVCEPEGVFFGTAGSLKLAEHLLNDTFMVVQGDTLFETPLGDMAAIHNADDGRTVTIALTEVANPSNFGVAVFDKTGQIRMFQEKPTPERAASHFASMGIYALEPEVLDYVESETWDFAQDLFPSLMKIERKISGYPTTSFWVDIGGLDGLLRGTRWVLNRLSGGKSYENRIGNPDSVIIGEGAEVGRGSVMTGPVLVEDGAIVGEGATVLPYAVIKEKALISNGATVGESVILERGKVGKGSSVKTSVIGEWATVGESVTVEGSIVGQGTILGDNVKVLSGSRIWPNIMIGTGETVDGMIAVPREKSFYFYLELGRYAGVLARSVAEFINAIISVPAESLEFHMKRRDFERWVREVVGCNELATQIGHLRKTKIEGENLRHELVRVLEEWMRTILSTNPDKEKKLVAEPQKKAQNDHLVAGEIIATQ